MGNATARLMGINTNAGVLRSVQDDKRSSAKGPNVPSLLASTEIGSDRT